MKFTTSMLLVSSSSLSRGDQVYFEFRGEALRSIFAKTSTNQLLAQATSWVRHMLSQICWQSSIHAGPLLASISIFWIRYISCLFLIMGTILINRCGTCDTNGWHLFDCILGALLHTLVLVWKVITHIGIGVKKLLHTLVLVRKIIIHIGHHETNFEETHRFTPGNIFYK